ncbi:hypothetical protein PV328_012454, partial [Microctonus aethiopoides]
MKKYYSDLLKNLEDGFKLCLNINDQLQSNTHANRWRRIGAKHLQLLNGILKKCKKRSEKVQVSTYISQIQSLIVKFNKVHRQNKNIIGGNINLNETSVKWNDLQSVFNGRIKT